LFHPDTSVDAPRPDGSSWMAQAWIGKSLGAAGASGQVVRQLPTYRPNPYTGGVSVTGGAYNLYTGAGVRYGDYQNPLTGASYNPYTGNLRRTTVRCW
jgi:hypothetical protein